MTTLSDLANAHPVIGRRWSRDQPLEQAQILGLARDALDFIFATGQRYRFEDFFKSVDSSTLAQHRDGSANLRELMSRTKSFFVRLLDESESAEEKEQIQAILDALHYIASTAQHDAFAAYLRHVEANAPPYVVASFATWQEAEAWLKAHPNPPDPANVLIANRYHDVVYDRETNIRRLPRNRDLEYYLAELKERESPLAVASFATHEEADAWLRAQSEPAVRAWVSIAGETYLAAYHPHINHRALYPLSMAEGHEEESKTPRKY